MGQAGVARGRFGDLRFANIQNRIILNHTTSLIPVMLLFLTSNLAAQPLDTNASDAGATVRAYFTAMNQVERLPLVSSPDRLKNCAAFREEELLRYPAPQVGQPRSENGSVVIDAVLTPNEKHQRKRKIFLVKEGGTYKIDWERSMERACNKVPLRVIAATRPKEAHDMKVFVRLSDHPISTDDLVLTHLSLWVEEQVASAERALVLKDSPEGKAIFEVLQDAGEHPMTLRLRFHNMPPYKGDIERNPVLFVEKVLNPSGWR
jgi:hypothetical protein